MDNSVPKHNADQKPWLKDVNLIIGIGGVIATIVVGIVTYWLTTDSVSRDYQERIKAAQNDALTIVVRSIGEGIVPDKQKIQSVLNSVRRQYNIKEKDFETPEVILDDILTRVLANEFLDAKRRAELSEKLIEVKAENMPETHFKSGNDLALTDENGSELSLERNSEYKKISALVFAVITSTSAALTLVLVKLLVRRRRLPTLSLPVIVAATAIVLVITIWIIMDTNRQQNNRLTWDNPSIIVRTRP